MRRIPPALAALTSGGLALSLVLDAALADEDAFLESPPRVLPTARGAPELPFGVQVRSTEPRLDVPTSVWVVNRPRPPRWAITPAGAALHFVEQLAPLYRLDAAARERVRVHEVHDRGEGVIIVSLHGEIDGVPLLRDELNVALDQKLRLIGLTGYLSPHLGGAASVANAFELSPRDAVQAALTRHLGVPFTDFAGAGVRDGWTRFTSTREQPLGAAPSGVVLGQPTRARRVLYGLVDRLEPAYHVEVTVETTDRSDMVAYVVSALDGRVLSVRDLVAQHPFTYRVFVDRTGRPLDSPNGNDEIPDFSATPALPPRDWATPDLITLDHANISTMDPWMTQSSTLTSGNNVDAYYDGNFPDGLTAGDFRAETTAPDTFDWTFDPETNASASDTQRKAAIVHAFYVSNWLHDEFYDSGLDETAGNAQRDNYGRGGVDGDDMRVEVQDYSGTNNANMATPADGGRPRMQMYLWTGTSRTSVRELSPGATDYVSNDATFGPRDFDETADLAVATDAGGVNSLDACDPPVSSAVSGNIALIERGNCTFATKALNAQNAGAIGAIIYDDNPNATTPVRLGGSEPAVTIGVVSVTRADGVALDTALGGGPVRVRIHRDRSVQTDSAVDSMVVAHEWGHYVSNRLIGNGFGLFGNQARGMGEGWSDFHGMMLTVQADDVLVASNAGFDGTYAGATSYVSRRGSYFGIRRVPYSTDFTKNGFTFRHIQANEPLPSVPTAFGSTGRFNTRVHQTGEVWATMLWGAWSALIDSPRHSFLDAYDRMKDYLVAGYKLTPVNPTFVEARDAILLAAFAQDVDDFELIYAAFARRGVGIGAEAPERFSTSQTPVVESFATGAFAELGQTVITDDVRWCDRDGALDGDERGELFIDVSNLGSKSFDDPVLEVRSLTPELTFPDGTTQQLLALPPFGGTTATVAVELGGLTVPTLAQIVVDVTDASLTFGPTQTSTVGFRVHFDEVPAFSATDDVEAAQTVWSRSTSSSFFDGFTRVAETAVQHSWFGATVPFPFEARLTSPPLPVAVGSTLTMAFRHRHDITSGRHGGVVELSTDNGATWEDVSTYVDPDYSGTINGQSNNPNPLRGRRAYTGRNPSYPGWDPVTLDFGSALAGQTVQLRFRLGTDWTAAGPGWSIDDIAFGGITSTPFAAVVADRGICINRPPLAQAGRDLVVPERTVATLDGSGSSDPDDDALSLDWTQVDGPAVTLTSTTGRFLAPEVATDTLLTFSLRVADGEYVSEPDFVSVLVTNVNRAPTAPTIDGPTAAVERANVTLTATATDPDGDAIVRYAWEQVDGPAATLTSTGAAVRFVAPEVTETATVTLRVAASDGLLFGPATEHAVLLRSENRLPFAPEVEAKVAVEGEWVSLVARAEDPDGDPLTYTFRPLDAQLDAEQLRGPSRFRFVAPQVDADASFRFEVRADDGFGESLPTTAIVNVTDIAEPPPEPEPDAGRPDAAGGGSVAAQDEGCGCTTTSGAGAAASPLVGIGLLAIFAVRRRPTRSDRKMH